LPNYPNIFVIGDMAHFAHQNGDAACPASRLWRPSKGQYVARRILKTDDRRHNAADAAVPLC
jgi:NADH dehydrogenase FAD-containing subunit